GPVHVGDFWTIGVRPATPDTVLPARLLRTPEPPAGPRLWACPLALIGWSGGELQGLDGCRVPVRPPVAQDDGSSCAPAPSGPADATRHGLQAIVDRATAARHAHDRARRVTVCLRPGRYELDRPLRLGRRHGHLHLEGCGEGVVLAVALGAEEAFVQGMI